MSHAWAYIRREAGGAVIVGATLIHARGRTEWAAPRASTEAEPARAAVQACAQWITKQLAEVPGSPELSLVLDLSGSRCGWFSAPGTEEQLVAAAVGAAQLESDNTEGGPTLSWLGDHEVGSDLSVQPLLPPPPPSKVRKKVDGATHRVALLSTGDLSVRLLLDELDLLSITPVRVISLWHALGEAWQGEREAAASVTASEDGSIEVAQSQSCAATVMLDPGGRLVWSWTAEGAGGGLLCAGSMLLRRSVDREPGQEQGEQPEALPQEDEISLIEITKSDVGRLVTEWLAWGAQLGLAPRRVACIGPENLVCVGLDDDLPNTPAVGALGGTLGRIWPDTAVAAHIESDPLEATLRRGVISANDLGVPGAGKNDSGEPTDPRSGLLELSRRPGRATRKVYAWNFVMVIAASIAIAALGFKLQQAAGDLDGQASAKFTARGALIAQVKDVAPRAQNDPDPKVPLAQALREMEEVKKKIVPEKPVLNELARLLAVLGRLGEDQIELKTLQISSLSPILSFSTVSADTGTLFTQQINDTPPYGNGPWLNWQGGRTSPARQAPGANSTMAYDFSIAAVWVETPKPAAAKAPAKPGDTKPAQPKATPDKPGDTKPAQPKATPDKPEAPATTESKPKEPKATESKPTETKQPAKPAEKAPDAGKEGKR